MRVQPSMFPLAVTAERFWTDLPYIERITKLSNLGFAVELWDWTQHDLRALSETGARWSLIGGSLRGDLYDEEGGKILVGVATESIAAARALDCPRIAILPAELDGSRGWLPSRPQQTITGAMWINAYRTLDRLASVAEDNGVVFCLENLNLVLDHPGTPFGRAEDTLTLVGELDRPGVRMLLDLYHAQVGEGNLIELCRRAGPYIGEIQVADVPGRMEPGTGEVDWHAVAMALNAQGYAGVVSLEASPSGDPVEALQAFRDAFSE